MSLLSVIRGYNILILIAAQYLAAIFIFSDTNSVIPVITDKSLLFLVLATICVVSGGYIINNFYDVKADLINRPVKSGIDNFIRQETQLSLYFILNFVGFCFGTLISWRAGLFFACYIFGIWFYSHKLKKLPVLGLISASTLTILPFFAIFIYYKNFSKIVFIHAIFLFLIIIIRELIKNLENIQGAIVSNYNTFTITYGEKKTKYFISVLALLTLTPISILLNHPAIHNMKYYFYISGITLALLSIYIHFLDSKNHYRSLHNILKILLLAGVLSLTLIDKSLILDKVIEVF